MPPLLAPNALLAALDARNGCFLVSLHRTAQFVQSEQVVRLTAPA